MGHADVSTTLGTYGHISLQAQREAAEKVGQMLGLNTRESAS